MIVIWLVTALGASYFLVYLSIKIKPFIPRGYKSVKLKEGVSVVGIEPLKEYRVIVEEKGVLCNRRYLVRNEYGTNVYLCSYDVELI